LNGSLIQRVRQVWRLSQAPRWAAPAVVGLALAAAALDGFGLYLFIPLLESLGAGDGAHPLARGFDALLAPVPQPWRLPVLVLTLCTTVAAKFGSSALIHDGGETCVLVLKESWNSFLLLSLLSGVMTWPAFKR